MVRILEFRAHMETFFKFLLQYWNSKIEITQNSYEYGFAFSSEYGVVGPHEYPPSSYKHVHVGGGEDGDQIMKSGSERI